MKKLLLLLVLISFQLNRLNAQDNGKGILTEGSDKNSFITINFIPPFLYDVPRVHVGYYKALNSRVIVGGELGYGSAELFNKRPWVGKVEGGTQYRAFEISPEVILLSKKNRKVRSFVSANVAFVRHTDVLEGDEFEEDNGPNFIRFSSADYRRLKFSITISAGLIFNITKKIGLITKLGGGVKMRSVKFSNLVDPSVRTMPNSDVYVHWPAYNQEGTKFGFDLNVDFKLYFKL